MKKAVLLGLGSNIEPELHLRAAAIAIRKQFPGARFSKVYRSTAVGMEAADFLNACCLLWTEMDRTVLHTWLKDLENTRGRDRRRGSWRPRTLDLDILMFDGEIVDNDLYRFPHVYIPAMELVSLPSRRFPAANLEAVPLHL